MKSLHFQAYFSILSTKQYNRTGKTSEKVKRNREIMSDIESKSEPQTDQDVDLSQVDLLSDDLELENPRRRIWRLRSFKFLRVTALTTIALIALLGFGTYSYLKNLGVFSLNVSRLDQISTFNFKDNTQVFDRKGNLIAEFYDSYQIYTPIKEIPKEMINAVIAIEDKRFYEHKGIDLKGIFRAAFQKAKGSKVLQGGSTITQQVSLPMFLTN